jgi:hypothetical protein
VCSKAIRCYQIILQAAREIMLVSVMHVAGDINGSKSK